MRIILQYRVIGPNIYDRVMHLHKMTAKRKVTVKRKVAFSLKPVNCTTLCDLYIFILNILSKFMNNVFTSIKGIYNIK